MNDPKKIAWGYPLAALITSTTLAVLFFSWALSTPLYEELHNIVGGRPYYGSKTITELPDIEAIKQISSSQYRATLYLRHAAATRDGPNKLKYIRLAIQATPEDPKSYDILYNLIETTPVEFGIYSYLNRLYALPGIRQNSVVNITDHRFEMFSAPEQQQHFIDNLSSELREALTSHRPKSLKELKTQMGRNE